MRCEVACVGGHASRADERAWQTMDDLGLDDMVSGVNKTGDAAKKDKNAQVQMMKKLRDNHFSVDKVVVRNDPVAKTAEDVFKVGPEACACVAPF